MERVIALVNKLQEQIENNSPLVYLTATAEMLVTELRQKSTTTHLGKVSIFHPTVLSPIINRVTIGNTSVNADAIVNTEAIAIQEVPLVNYPLANEVQEEQVIATPSLPIEAVEPLTPTMLIATDVVATNEPEKIVYTLDITEESLLAELPVEAISQIAQETIATQQEPILTVVTPAHTIDLPQPVVEEKPILASTMEDTIDTNTLEPTTAAENNEAISEKTDTPSSTDKKNTSFLQTAFFMDEQFAHIPTLPIQEPKKEYFELAGNFENEPSINDSLKQHHQQQEVGSTLQETPLKDLRKGIGINDRFIFINELFRGDEAMYERSLKTINNFSIFPEAEFWIKRELKVKLGWDSAADSVKLFDQLVRRRFS